MLKLSPAFGLLVTLALLPFTSFSQPIPPLSSAQPILWDPGLTHEGTRLVFGATDIATNFLYKVTTANPSVGAWRTALKLQSGEANIFMSRGVVPTTTSFGFKSDRPGSDGFVLSSTQFAPNEVWYILVQANAGARFSLISGAPYVQDIGSIAADDSSGSGDVIMGPEGIRFFSARVPTDMLAWRLWLNGATNTILLKKTGVPLPGGSLSELSQVGQALVVPPYLTGGQQYFIGVVGTPGTTNRLDSRQQAIIDLAYGTTTPTNDVTGYPYTTYRIQVPAQQIAWRVAAPGSKGNPNISLRRNTVPNESNNDALSELAPPLTDNIALVPPVLSDGTFYVTVWATNKHDFVLQNGPAVVSEIDYIDSVVNDDPTRVGWRYYRVTDISQQLGSLGWHLTVTNHAPGTRIAIRRNAAPGIWSFKNPNPANATYFDLLSVAQTLQEPGHQADVWYVGVYNPTNALGNFTLTTKELDPGPQIPPWQTATYVRTNVNPGVWEYFRLDLPVAGTQPGLGWDLRLKDVTGNPLLVVRRDLFPTNLSSAMSLPVNATNWGTGVHWAAGGDWTSRLYGNVGNTNENGRILTMPLGRPLQPGRYYIGVQSAVGSTQSVSFTLQSRWVGETMEIPVRTLNWSGANFTNTVAPREADYFAVVIPPNTRSFKARLRMLSGEGMLAVSKETLPNVSSVTLNSVINTSGKSIQKAGDEYFNLFPPRGSNYLSPGTYYLAVIGEGTNPPDNLHIGEGTSSYVLQTLGALPEPNIGLLGTDLTTTGSLAGGDANAYHFNTEPGVLGFWVLIENEIGNPVAVSSPEITLADPGLASNGYGIDYYGNDGGIQNGAAAGQIIAVANPFATETIMVKARPEAGGYPDASYTLHISRIMPDLLPFDGGVTSVTNGNGDKGQFFYVDVPPDALGWDLRLTNVTSGDPVIVVRKDYIPISLGTTIGFNPALDDEWFPGEQWMAGRDWTERALSPAGEFEDGRILTSGIGRPLEPGRYYVGVFGMTSEPVTYSIWSRGIGENMSIPVTPMSFNGGSSTVTSLAPREVAYYSFVIPTNTPSWKVHLTASRGESMLIASKDSIPNVLVTPQQNMTNSTGRKMQKTGDEYFLLLPPAGTNVLLPGRYYLAVVSEGVSPAPGRVGSTPVDFTLTSIGQAPIRNLGQLGVTDLVETNLLAGGDTQIYQFTIPAGTLGLEARLEDRVQNPVMVLRGGNRAGPAGAGQLSITPEPYGNENGDPAGIDVHPSLISVGNITNNVYTLVVMARSITGGFTNASYTLRLNASGTTTVDFDGGTASVTDQAVRTWKYFRVTVPPTANGWDFRVLNVASGQPRVVVRRESLPSVLSTAPWSAPSGQTSWPTNAQWAPLADWTKRSFSSTNAALNEDGRIFACGMGRPLEPGTYFVGVFNNHATATANYTVLSRGIGPELAIPLIDIPFVGSYSVTLPAREAAYFRVVVPSNSPSWKVKMTGDSGEAMMIGLRGNIPSIDLNNPTGTLPNGRGMQKAGNEHFVLLPVQGQTNLPSSTNYFVVISEGVNPAGSTRIGSGSSSITFESEGALPVNPLGVVTSEDLVQPDVLQAGEVKAYQFLVPSGTLGLKVRLGNRAGNPTFVLRYGDKIPDPGAAVPTTDTYGNEGGYASTDGNALLYTVPNPLPGLYTISVKARPVNTTTFPDASYSLRVQEILVPETNFSADQNTNGLSNVVSGILDDNERVYYKFIIPETHNGQPVIGWRLELAQSSGLASMRVRKDILPSDAAAATQMNFTTASTVIVPPFLTNGVWYVEVKGTGSTAYQLTSNPLTLERPVWVMPEPGQPSGTPGVIAPLFGDSGIDTNGFPLPGDSSTFLEQGTLHYYAVSVPTNNNGVLRAVLEAVSGNPDIYLRHGVPPTLYHNTVGANGTIYDRSMLANATEYANWVPIDGKLETTLKPGLWYMAVRAAGNANTRYRLKLAAGSVSDLPLNAPAVSGQLLAGGDWRYYKFTAPTTLPGGFNLTFSEQSGDVVVYLRDTIPPGNGNTGAAADYKDWAADNKNQATYQNFNTPGTYSFAAPPLRPGATYYLGVRAVSDASFTIRTTTNGVPNTALPTIAFYGGSAVTNLAPGQQSIYRIDVPAEATRWKHTATHAAGIQFYIEQGTLPTKGGTDDFRNLGATANHTYNQYLLGAWPWVPGQQYYLLITNTTAVSQDIVFAMDGRNPDTDDNDNDALPDAWELQYFGNTTSQLAAGDPDRDGVTNYDEFLEGTDPDSADSFRARLLTSSIFGVIVRSPDAPSYELNQQVTLVATPDPGYAFIGWSGNASGLNNPLVLTMDDHKNITARFKLAGDDFITALPLTGGSATIVSSNVGMSKETGEPNHAGNPGGKSIWWRWTAPSSGEVTLTTAGTPFNTLLAVYTGNSVTTLTRIASDNASGGVTNRSVLKFAATSGQTYNIAVDGYNAASGRINLSLSMGGSTVGSAPSLVPISRSANGTAQIQLIGDANYTYPIQTSTNLVDWVPLGTVTTDQTGVGLFNHAQSPNSYGFYRTRE